MGSREREQPVSTIKHHTHLSSLVVRPTESGGGGSDYEPGEVRRDPPIYSRSDRFPDSPGSGSPLHYRNLDHRYGSDFDHSGGPQHGRGYRGTRGRGRFRDSSPPYGRGRGGGRFSERDFDGPGFGSGPFSGEGMTRNNPNVSPREGDWICPEPSCGNLNFARRDYCNNCNRLRFGPGPGDSPRRNYNAAPRPRAPMPRFSSPPLDRSPGRGRGRGRGMNGYRSPPRSGWGRDGPREFINGPPHPRRGGTVIRRGERPDYRQEEDYRERARFDRASSPPDRFERDRGRDNFNERREYEGRNERGPPPPPLSPPHRSQWRHDDRERSRSPIRGGGPPLKEYRRGSFIGRGRDDRRGRGGGRFGGPY